MIGESNVAIDPAIGGYGAADIYLGEFSPQWYRRYAVQEALQARTLYPRGRKLESREKRGGEPPRWVLFLRHYLLLRHWPLYDSFRIGHGSANVHWGGFLLGPGVRVTDANRPTQVGPAAPVSLRDGASRRIGEAAWQNAAWAFECRDSGR